MEHVTGLGLRVFVERSRRPGVFLIPLRMAGFGAFGLLGAGQLASTSKKGMNNTRV